MSFPLSNLYQDSTLTKSTNYIFPQGHIEFQFGTAIRNFALEFQFGTAIWNFALEFQFGTSVQLMSSVQQLNMGGDALMA
jgi:hypothetical protein